MFIAVNSARQLSIVLSHVEVTPVSVASSGCNTWIWANPQIEGSYVLAYHQARHILRAITEFQESILRTTRTSLDRGEQCRPKLSWNTSITARGAQ